MNKEELERDTRETDLNDGLDLEKAASRTAEENLAEKEEVRILAEDGTDVIIVDWDSPQDPAFPKNWSNGRRMGATLVFVNFTASLTNSVAHFLVTASPPSLSCRRCPPP